MFSYLSIIHDDTQKPNGPPRPYPNAEFNKFEENMIIEIETPSPILDSRPDKVASHQIWQGLEGLTLRVFKSKVLDVIETTHPTNKDLY